MRRKTCRYYLDYFKEKERDKEKNIFVNSNIVIEILYSNLLESSL